MSFSSDYTQRRAIQQARTQSSESFHFVRMEANRPPSADSPLRYAGQVAPARRVGSASTLSQAVNRRQAQQTMANRRLLAQRPAVKNVNHSRTEDVRVCTMQAPSASPVIGSTYTPAVAQALAKQQAASARAAMNRAQQASVGRYGNQRPATAAAVGRPAVVQNRLARPALAAGENARRVPGMVLRTPARPKLINTSHTSVNNGAKKAAVPALPPQAASTGMSVRAPSQTVPLQQGGAHAMDAHKSRELTERSGEIVLLPGERLMLQPTTPSTHPGFRVYDD